MCSPARGRHSEVSFYYIREQVLETQRGVHDTAHVHTRTHNAIFASLFPKESRANEEVVFVASRCPEQL